MRWQNLFSLASTWKLRNRELLDISMNPKSMDVYVIQALLLLTYTTNSFGLVNTQTQKLEDHQGPLLTDREGNFIVIGLN